MFTFSQIRLHMYIDPCNTAQILIMHQIKCDQICKNLPYTQETHKQLQVNHLA